MITGKARPWRAMCIIQKGLHLTVQVKDFFFLIEVELIYHVVLISAVQQSDSVIYMYILFHTLFHYGLSQDIEYSSPCYTVGPCCLSILYIIGCIC